MQEYKHKCIKPSCENYYTDNDPDAYYCETCNEERKRIAKDIDSRLTLKPKKVQSTFTEKDFKGRGGRIFFNAKEFGI